jgi:hypothetical protein
MPRGQRRSLGVSVSNASAASNGSADAFGGLDDCCKWCERSFVSHENPRKKQRPMFPLLQRRAPRSRECESCPYVITRDYLGVDKIQLAQDRCTFVQVLAYSLTCRHTYVPTNPGILVRMLRLLMANVLVCVECSSSMASACLGLLYLKCSCQRANLAQVNRGAMGPARCPVCNSRSELIFRPNCPKWWYPPHRFCSRIGCRFDFGSEDGGSSDSTGSETVSDHDITCPALSPYSPPPPLPERHVQPVQPEPQLPEDDVQPGPQPEDHQPNARPHGGSNFKPRKTQ